MPNQIRNNTIVELGFSKRNTDIDRYNSFVVVWILQRYRGIRLTSEGNTYNVTRRRTSDEKDTCYSFVNPMRTVLHNL